MAADELTALQRAAGVVSELDPATAWDLDGQLDGLSQVALTLAEGMGTWSERLHGIGLHVTVTDPIETGITGLGEIAAGLTQSRRALRTAYAGFFAAAEASVRAIDRPAFWGADAVSRGRHSAPPPTPAAGEQIPAPAGWTITDPGTAPAPGQPRGQVEPGPVPDAADLTGRDNGHWRGSDVVAGPDGTKAWLGLVQYAEPGQEPSGTYVAVGTSTGEGWDPDSTAAGIIPHLSAQEAAQLADELDNLIALAQSGAAAPPPTKLAKLADRIRGLLGGSGVNIIGDEGETEVSAEMIQQLLDAAAPAPTAPTRRKIHAKDCGQDGMDDGTVWIELDTSGDAPAIAVTSVEGKEQPEDYPDGYTTTKLPLDDASQLAAKLRRFAQATADDAGETGHGQPTVDAGQPAAAEPVPAPTGPRRVSNTSGKQFEYDPETGATAVIESDGWRAVVPASSSTGIAARLLYWNAEIKAGRGDDATDEAARALLSGLTATELREVADEIGASVPSSRTKPQLVDTITKAAVSSPRKHLGLRAGGRERYVPPANPAPDQEPAAPASVPPVPAAAMPTPGRSPEEIRPPNGQWGKDQGLMHFNGAFGRLWNDLGDDRHLAVNGHALGNLVTDLGEGITLHRHDTNQALEQLRQLRRQLPDGRAGRLVDQTIARLDAPPRPAPPLPEQTPEPLRTLMTELNAINLVRRGHDDGMPMSSDGTHETDLLADLARQWANGEITRGKLEAGVRGLTRLRHESMEGWTEIRDAVSRALTTAREWVRPN